MNIHQIRQLADQQVPHPDEVIAACRVALSSTLDTAEHAEVLYLYAEALTYYRESAQAADLARQASDLAAKARLTCLAVQARCLYIASSNFDDSKFMDEVTKVRAVVRNSKLSLSEQNDLTGRIFQLMRHHDQLQSA